MKKYYWNLKRSLIFQISGCITFPKGLGVQGDKNPHLLIQLGKMCRAEADQNRLSITAAADAAARGEKLEGERKLISTTSHGKF